MRSTYCNRALELEELALENSATASPVSPDSGRIDPYLSRPAPNWAIASSQSKTQFSPPLAFLCAATHRKPHTCTFDYPFIKSQNNPFSAAAKPPSLPRRIRRPDYPFFLLAATSNTCEAFVLRPRILWKHEGSTAPSRSHVGQQNHVDRRPSDRCCGA